MHSAAGFLTDIASPPRLRFLWPIPVGPGKPVAVQSRAQVRFHDLAVEMPSRMGEHRQHHREPNEERQRADHQGNGDEEPPGRHHQRIAENRLTDVCIATITPTSRSSSSGKETTPIVSAKTANRKPMPYRR